MNRNIPLFIEKLIRSKGVCSAIENKYHIGCIYCPFYDNETECFPEPVLEKAKIELKRIKIERLLKEKD
jgi:hypothetical protein